ncbi:MAG TPA: ABC transporter ATP-binding protein [Euzebyales bacterium]|nr:ABC transporter ATP-binding protein [Euzebyales bacterium]
MAATITVTDLRKRYGGVRAVDGLSFEVDEGQVCALLGPNGAGKTTTVEILEGHRSPTSGQVRVLGFDPATGGRDYRERIGIVLQEAGFDEEQTVRELVDMYAGFYPRRLAVADVIDLVGLGDKADARVKGLSGGQRRRLDLALGLVGDPDVLFLDEPTTGFDPAARRRAWELIDSLRDLGKTILLTTHYMDEAQHLADHVVVIAAGTLAWHGTPEELIARAGALAVVRFRLPADVSDADLPDLDAAVHADGDLVEITGGDPLRVLHDLTGWALRRGLTLAGLALDRQSLEDAYLGLLAEEVDRRG